jgi:adenylylsulfate kinase
MGTPENIHPIFDQLLSKDSKESQLNQRAKTFWMTGLSGSGKSTIAKGVEKALHAKGYMTKLLDGDNVRSGLCNNLGFSEEDRRENIRRISEVSKLFVDCGIITINSFVSPTNEIRAMARDIIGEENFIEVYINTSFEECERRDVKGLYAKARAGEIKNFTGLDAPFEAPENAQVVITTAEQSPEESVETMMNQILPLIEYK